ncbi:MAG: hypothetical protein DRQ62_00010 [Gammaproteobacteria bacterium]|nr:MAG: hypothetical protein DRQ62_00010 [Gammaproteobacteria bacterium]
MGRYENLQTEVFSVFASTAWVAETIKTYPENYLAVTPGEEFLKVYPIPSGQGINFNSTSGLLIIDIFVSAGAGPSRVNQLADKLDLYLAGKSISTATAAVCQFQDSSLKIVGTDKDNSSLYRATYTIPFNYFGVQ